MYNSQYEFYELFRHLISKYPINDFNETLAFARLLQPPNGNENGTFNALADIWLRHHSHVYSFNFVRHLTRLNLQVVLKRFIHYEINNSDL